MPMGSKMRNRTRRLLAGFSVVILVVGVCLLLRPEDEMKRIEAKTVWAAEKWRLINSGTVCSSPKLVLELLFTRSKDPGGDATREFFAGMDRLEQSGIVEKRKFMLADTNVIPVVMSNLVALTSTVLWDAESETNSVIVRAKGSEMERIERIIAASESHLPAAAEVH
jgi:hypothetical protein